MAILPALPLPTMSLGANLDIFVGLAGASTPAELPSASFALLQQSGYIQQDVNSNTSQWNNFKDWRNWDSMRNANLSLSANLYPLSDSIREYPTVDNVSKVMLAGGITFSGVRDAFRSGVITRPSAERFFYSAALAFGLDDHRAIVSGNIPLASDLLSFYAKLREFNDQLRSFDAAGGLRRGGKELTAEQQAAIDSGSLQALAADRQKLVSANFVLHTLASADSPNSPTYKHLDAHLKAVDLGSYFEFGAVRVFAGPSGLIRFSEDWLGQAYRGEIKPGDEIELTVESTDGPVSGRLRFLQSGEIADGVNVGPSGPGGRVVMRVTFDRPVGKNAVRELSGGEVILHAERLSGGRKESVNVMDGRAEDSNTFYIMGGPYGPTGTFGIFTIFTGIYSPPISDSAYWQRHAFLTGDDPESFKILEDGSVAVTEGSALAQMIANGVVAIPSQKQ